MWDKWDAWPKVMQCNAIDIAMQCNVMSKLPHVGEPGRDRVHPKQLAAPGHGGLAGHLADRVPGDLGQNQVVSQCLVTESGKKVPNKVATYRRRGETYKKTVEP